MGAPQMGSFGARIQLALLLGIITEADAEVLRGLKQLRNSVAHRIRLDLKKEPYLSQVRGLAQAWKKQANAIRKGRHILGSPSQINEIEKYLTTLDEAGEGLVLAVFTVYHAYMHLLTRHVTRIQPFI